jgi:three-Cys-motif partner protein
MPRCEDGCPADKRPETGNCFDPDPGDGLPVQCVGAWERDKHDPLERYIAASSGPRGWFLKPRPGVSVPGGAAFVDLYAGPGRARVRSTGAVVDGSPLIALKHGAAPFTKVIACELDPGNAAALRARVAPFGERAVVIEGSCHDRIGAVVAEIPASGLNFALIDPYSLDQLDFETISRLAAVERMDMLIHFPTMDAKRNWGQGSEARLTKALGTEAWRDRVRKPRDVTRAIDVLRDRLQAFGYTGQDVRSVEVRNSTGGVLYHLVYASKHKKGDEIWQSIAKTLKGQRSLL